MAGDGPQLLRAAALPPAEGRDVLRIATDERSFKVRFIIVSSLASMKSAQYFVCIAAIACGYEARKWACSSGPGVEEFSVDRRILRAPAAQSWETLSWL